MHQDAHEFLNYTLNTIAEDVQKYQKRIAEEKETKHGSIHSEGSNTTGM
jgi:ubiquitin C-terminal hydrolase